MARVEALGRFYNTTVIGLGLGLVTLVTARVESLVLPVPNTEMHLNQQLA